MKKGQFMKMTIYEERSILGQFMKKYLFIAAAYP